MGYDKDVLSRARTRHTELVEQHRQAQRHALEEAYARVPEAARLDRQIRGTMGDVAAQAFRSGEDPTQALAAIRQENLSLQQRRAHLLRQAGYDPDSLREGPRCRRCGDTGYIGQTMCSCLRRLCQEEQQKELTSLLRSDASFDDFSLDYYPTAVNPVTGLSPRTQMELIYETCVDYASHFQPDRARSLLMCGPPGLGKTLLSACIAREVVTRGYSVVYDTAIHVFSCMEKQKFGGGTEEDLRTAERVAGCDLLILDDLGSEMTTSFIAPALYTIVNGRLMSERPTIISTNLTIAQISQRYSTQIASRLGGLYNILPFDGQDIRALNSPNRSLGAL